MEIENFQPLVDGIRACFPAITRERVFISPAVAKHNGSVQIVRVRVTLDERFPSFDADGLMTLLNADEMSAKDGQSTIKGTFAGKPCVLILASDRPA